MSSSLWLTSECVCVCVCVCVYVCVCVCVCASQDREWKDRTKRKRANMSVWHIFHCVFMCLYSVSKVSQRPDGIRGKIYFTHARVWKCESDLLNHFITDWVLTRLSGGLRIINSFFHCNNLAISWEWLIHGPVLMTVRTGDRPGHIIWRFQRTADCCVRQQLPLPLSFLKSRYMS